MFTLNLYSNNRRSPTKVFTFTRTSAVTSSFGTKAVAPQSSYTCDLIFDLSITLPYPKGVETKSIFKLDLHKNILINPTMVGHIEKLEAGIVVIS